MANRCGKMENSDWLDFHRFQNYCRWWLQPWIKRYLLIGRKPMTNPDGILKSRDITLPTKVHLIKAMLFPVVMYGCESWTIKKAEHWRNGVFELWCWGRLLRVPWTARRSNQSILNKGNQPWIFFGRTDAGVPILWPLNGKNRLTGKDPDAGEDWGQEEKGSREDEMVGWHYWLNGHELEQTPGDSEGQGTLVCCTSGVTELTERLNNSNNTYNCLFRQSSKCCSNH